ncbi:LysR substrate-binding domain-containing protein [Solirubrobacter phytolaccae]|uniref:LysR substrate-binding domain-containing protein n=1 Tax=Solirubrobacter phytolaccae TaxID=1404360 RepID=A0A9X3NCM4_9ACTN|nr:LysR substrate-binding domain-containing protein [Solirubrobacter phytolaccae]MDA0184003.1 LysR substrate-binding domain-containing protein [Solirubrobacter phytolaccae]
MELRQLEYFVVVAEEGSFTRGAERVLVAQSGVSAQVRRLERELGAELLVRGGRRVTLTEAGAAVLPFARDALAATRGVRTAVEELTGLLRGQVRIGMITAGPAQLLTGLLADFSAAHPGVEMTLVEMPSDELFAAVRAGELDLACASLGPGAPEGLETHVVIDAPVVAAVAPSHPLAARTRITIDELADHPLICLPRGTGIRALLDAAGLQARVAFEASDPGVLAQLAGRGLGVAVLPEPAVGDLHALELGLRGQVALAWRAGGPSGAAARAFISLARGSV